MTFIAFFTSRKWKLGKITIVFLYWLKNEVLFCLNVNINILCFKWIFIQNLEVMAFVVCGIKQKLLFPKHVTINCKSRKAENFNKVCSFFFYSWVYIAFLMLKLGKLTEINVTKQEYIRTLHSDHFRLCFMLCYCPLVFY